MTEAAKRIAATIATSGGEWFQRMAEATSDLISVLDTRGRRVYANPAIVRLLGAPDSLIGMDAFRDIHPEDRERIRKLFAQTVAEGVGRRAEYRLLLANGEVRQVESQGNPIPGPDGQVNLIVVVARDVTERRRVEDALRAREVQLQEAQAVASLGSWEVNLLTGTIWWSDQLRRIYGVGEDHVPTVESHSASVHAEDKAAVDEATRIAFATGRVYDKPFRILRPDGSVRVVFNSGRMERDAEGRPTRMLGVCIDVTDKTWIERRAHSVTERLRAVSRRLVEAQETERRTLARELHDRVGQTLTALGLNLRVIGAELSPESKLVVTAHLDDCMRLVEDTVDAMRSLMGDLRPHVLDDYGLLAALRSYASAYAGRTGIRVQVEGRDVHDLVPRNVEVVLFRIAQEALNNIAKHSRATMVEVTLGGGARRATLALADDGVGFDPAQSAAAGRKQGWGLMIMRERAEAIGAQFDLQSAPGRGVRVLVDYSG